LQDIETTIIVLLCLYKIFNTPTTTIKNYVKVTITNQRTQGTNCLQSIFSCQIKDYNKKYTA